MQRPGRYWGVMLLALLAVGCGSADSQTAAATSAATPPPEDVELAVLMGEMQRHGAKLGFAINGYNKPLAAFYLAEVEEVLAELMTVEEDEGMPIAHPAGVIMKPALATLTEGLASDEVSWPDVAGHYETVIAACNRCHAATEHEFIEVLPATGTPPFNQRFDAKSQGASGPAEDS